MVLVPSLAKVAEPLVIRLQKPLNDRYYFTTLSASRLLKFNDAFVVKFSQFGFVGGGIV